jgi:hypothetical protein
MDGDVKCLVASSIACVSSWPVFVLDVIGVLAFGAEASALVRKRLSSSRLFEVDDAIERAGGGRVGMAVIQRVAGYARFGRMPAGFKSCMASDSLRTFFDDGSGYVIGGPGDLY